MICRCSYCASQTRLVLSVFLLYIKDQVLVLPQTQAYRCPICRHTQPDPDYLRCVYQLLEQEVSPAFRPKKQLRVTA